MEQTYFRIEGRFIAPAPKLSFPASAATRRHPRSKYSVSYLVCLSISIQAELDLA